MKDFLLEVSSSIISEEMARVDFDEAVPECSTFTEIKEDNDISPSYDGKTYSIKLKAGQFFCCSETGIKFQVGSPATVEYEVEYGRKYMEQIKDSGYELVGPLFNVTVKSGVVSSVHLPHYLHLEGLGGDTSIIKYGHIKGEKVHLKTPTTIESSYIVFDNPSFSRAGVMIRLPTLWRLKKKSIPISGKVLLFFTIMSPHKEEYKEYRTHLYLLPCKKPELSKLYKVKEKEGFKMIAKPGNAKFIVGNTYTLNAGTDAKIIPQSLQFETTNPVYDLHYTEINVGGSATSIFLTLDGPEQKELWTGELTRADLEHHSARMSKLLEKDYPERHFVMKHRHYLIQGIHSVEPVIDNLCKKNLLTDEERSNVRSKGTPQEKMRELFEYVSRWGDDEKDDFQKVLLKCNPSIMKVLEDKS